MRDAEVEGRRILVRADLNVPLEDGRVADDTRIRAALPTLELLRDRAAASVTVCSHLGRPKGLDPAYSMNPVEERLRELFDGDLTVLENTRFNPGEPTTTRSSHVSSPTVTTCSSRMHSARSTALTPRRSASPSCCRPMPASCSSGSLAELGKLLGEVQRPFVLVSGGAKVEDKLGVLRNLGGKADSVLVGGKMAEELRDGDQLPFPVELPERRRRRYRHRQHRYGGHSLRPRSPRVARLRRGPRDAIPLRRANR